MRQHRREIHKQDPYFKLIAHKRKVSHNLLNYLQIARPIIYSGMLSVALLLIKKVCILPNVSTLDHSDGGSYADNGSYDPILEQRRSSYCIITHICVASSCLMGKKSKLD